MDSPEKIPTDDKVSQSGMKVADSIVESPVIILVCATAKFPTAETFVIPAIQNLLLTVRALGVGGTIATLHASVEARVHELFAIPESAQIVYCVSLGYSKGGFGQLNRKPLTDVVSENSWGELSGWL